MLDIVIDFCRRNTYNGKHSTIAPDYHPLNMVFDEENDLVYPNLVHCHIATSNAFLAHSTSSSSASSPPPSSFVVKRIEDSFILKKPSLERYKFNVERRVLARAKQRETCRSANTSRAKGENDSGQERGGVEVTMGKGDRKIQV